MDEPVVLCIFSIDYSQRGKPGGRSDRGLLYESEPQVFYIHTFIHELFFVLGDNVG